MRWDVFVGAFINSFFFLMACASLMKVKLQIKSKRFIISYILLSMYIYASFLTTQMFFRTILFFGVAIFINYHLYKKDKVSITKIVLSSFIAMMILFISEILFALIVILIFHIDLEGLQSNILGNFLCNCLIIGIFDVLIFFPIFNKFYVRLLSEFENLKIKYLIVVTFISIMAISITLYLSYFRFNVVFTFSLNLIIVFTYVYIIYALFYEKENALKKEKELEILEKSLDEYEKMYQHQRMLNHEHNNELIVIRGLIKNNKKAKEYIDEIANLKTKGNESWMEKLKEIPEGGLRGILYYKLLSMEEKKINIDFNVSRDVSVSDINKIDDNTKKNLCKLLGIYLDNAVQATQNLDNRYVKIDIYKSVMQNKVLTIAIMNNFEGNIDFSQINIKGYSTKGKGRGMGLAIANEILNNNANIKVVTKVIKNNFVQEINI